MTRQRFSVDTNILIYSIDKDAGPRHEQARVLMDALADTDCVLTLQALGEFFHAVTRKAKMPADEAAALVHDRRVGAMRLENPFKADFELDRIDTPP